MCPVCIGTVALIAAGTTSTGGLTALVARTLSKKRAPEKQAKKAATNPSPGANDGTTEDSVTR
jgi:hypothetical protein